MAGMMTWDLKKNKPLQTHAEDVKKKTKKLQEKRRRERKEPTNKNQLLFYLSLIIKNWGVCIVFVRCSGN